MDDAQEKLKRLEEALSRFEQNAAAAKRLRFDQAYWDGRIDAIRDLKDEIELLKKELSHGDAANPSAGS